MMNYTLQALGFITAGVIFWRAELVLNLMSKDCLFLIRLSFWLLVAGSLGFNLKIMEGYIPPVEVLLALGGVAMLLVAERRIGAILRMHTPVAHDRRSRP